MPKSLNNDYNYGEVSYPQQKPRGNTLWNRIFRRVEPDNSQIDLANRITELTPQFSIVNKELQQVLDNFASNESLYPFVREIVDPMLRELRQLKSQLDRKPSTDTLEKYSQWTEKARIWVQLCGKVSDEIEIIDAIVQHILKRSLELIERDIKLITEYQIHQKSKLDITAYIQKLEELKKSPQVSLQNISEWRARLDVKRAALVNSTLKAIDKQI